jgi:iron complex outermembrane recepter protein
MIGSFGLQQHRLHIGMAREHLNVYATASQTQLNGFRVQSAARTAVVNTKIAWMPNATSQYTLLFNYADAPRGNDPGALTLAEAQTNARLARPQNITFQGGETLSQGRIGFTTRHQLTANQTLEGRIFYLFRRFDSRLPLRPSGIVAFDRTFAGGGLVWSHRHNIAQEPARLRVQAEWETQQDDRTRFDNLNGTRGNLVTDQRESFTNLGSGILYDWQPGRWTLLGGLRYDGFRLRLRDHLLTDGDDSGTRRYDVVNPLLGVTYSANLFFNVYANAATAFETPTLNELANPTGFGGFNPNLNPQRSTSTEMGVKGANNSRWRYDLAVFIIQTESELVPYEETNQPGRTFFRNAGSTRRRGVEASADWCLYRQLWLTGNYTFSQFRYQLAPDVRNNGKSLPGLAPHNGLIALRWQPEQGFFGVIQAQYTDRLYADDANAIAIAPVWLASARGGYVHRFKRNIRLEAFAGLQNIGNTRYFSNIRINAVGGRYYEPGPDRGWYAGVGLAF